MKTSSCPKLTLVGAVHRYKRVLGEASFPRSLSMKRLLYRPAGKLLGSYGLGLGSFSDLSHGDAAASDR